LSSGALLESDPPPAADGGGERRRDASCQAEGCNGLLT